MKKLFKLYCKIFGHKCFVSYAGDPNYSDAYMEICECKICKTFLQSMNYINYMTFSGKWFRHIPVPDQQKMDYFDLLKKIDPEKFDSEFLLYLESFKNLK